MDHRKPLPLSRDQMEEIFRGEKTAADIVRETGERLRKKVTAIMSESKKPAPKAKTKRSATAKRA